MLQTAESDLLEIRQILGRLAERERDSVTMPADEAELVGVISTTEPSWIRRTRAALRLMHYALSTETAYVGWALRFMKHVGSEDLEKFGAPELRTPNATSVAASLVGEGMSLLLLASGVKRHTKRRSSRRFCEGF